MTVLRSLSLGVRFFAVVPILGAAYLFAGVPNEPPEETPAEKKPEPKVKSDPKKTYEVKPEGFKIETALSGVIEACDEFPISLNLKRWSDMRVVSAVPHGAQVKKGDVLIELETENLEKKIQDLKRALPVSEADLRTAELELEKLEQSTPILLDQARRAKVDAENDLGYFHEVSRPMRERDVVEDVKSTKNYLAYAEEELAQLKKMYANDDLTEETEEIIMQRAQNSVDNYKWMLEQTEERGKRTLETTIPRDQVKLETALDLQRIEWQADEKAFGEKLEKERLAVKNKRREVRDAKLSLAEHESDLESMKVTSPQSGIVYYGMSQRGKWITALTVERKLIPGSALSMREILMTVVNPSAVQLRVAVKEEELRYLAEGQSGTASLKWNPVNEWKATIESISYVPFPDNSFDTTIGLEAVENAGSINPGMTANAEIVTYEKADALLVPKAAVSKDEDTEEETVTLSGGEKRVVETGRADGEKIEILAGLEAGEVVELPSKKDSGSKADAEKVEKS